MNAASKNFLIYSASAGAGKTFTLVSSYLCKILEQGGSFSQVLAITFTNKATAEMKARIIAELDLLATGKASNHLPVLLQELSFKEDEIRSRAKNQLQKILHDYSSFSVSTIDSYFQVLTRTLTRELKIPVKFDIELNEERIRHEIAARVLAKAGYDDELTTWLRDLLFDKLEQGKGWKIQPELRSMTAEVMHKEAARHLASTADREKIRLLLQELNAIRNEFEGNLNSIATAALSEISNAGFTINDFAYNSNGGVGYFGKLLIKNVSKWEVGKRVVQAIENPDTLLTAANRKNAPLAQLANEILHPLLCQAVEIYNAGLHQYISAEAVRKFLFYTGIIPVIGDELKSFRDEQQVFLLSDTTRLLRDNIAGQDAPFIFEKSGIRYKHVFIDEFQDTSSDQWHILLPLARNTLANGDQLLLVGDAKQSIYRWRGGNIHLIRKEAAENLNQFKSVLDLKVLDTNWRSAEQIVNFNNAFFPLFADTLYNQFADFNDEELKGSYAPALVEQKFTPKNAGKGYLNFTFFKTAGKNETAGEEEEEFSGWKDRALQKLKVAIDESVESGYRLQDIAILFRTNAEEATLASWLLQNTKYEFISSNSLKLNTNPSVRFLLNCLYILAETDQPVHRVEAADFLATKEIQDAKDEIPHARIRKFEDDSWFKTVLLPLQKQSVALPINLVIALLREKGMLNEADPFLDAFEDVVSEYTAKQAGGIIEFLTWWEEQLETKEFCLDMPESANAIRMLSIHRSKGLEFPVVIVPFADWKVLPDQRTKLWASSDLAPFNTVDHLLIAAGSSLLNSVFSADYSKECSEAITDNLNVVYVAFTRPKDRLYVFSSAASRSDYISAALRESVASTDGFETEETDVFQSFTRGVKSPATTGETKAQSETLYTPQTIGSASPKIKAALRPPELAAAIITREINFGKALHEVIAYTFPKDSLPKQLYNASLKYQVPLQELEPAATRVMTQLEQNGWLSESWKVYPETDFCDAEGNIFRPDRVLSSEKETVVLDFKTGTPAKEYLEQVEQYCRLLEATGFPEVKGYLVYPAADLIQEVV
jgi:ATP-dependent helicase/nuclease subunit A